MQSLLAFLLPSSSIFQVGLIGQLYIGELFAVAIVAGSIYSTRRLFAGGVLRLLLWAALGWLCVQIGADVVNWTPFDRWAKGLARVIFLIACLYAVYLMCIARVQNIKWITLGICFFYIISPQMIFGFGDPLTWKFGVGLAAAMLVAISLTRFDSVGIPGRNLTVYVALMVLGAISLTVFSSRNVSGVIIISAFLGIYMEWQASLKGGGHSMERWSPIPLWIPVVLVSSVGFSILTIYTIGAPQGWFGEEMRYKFEMQFLEGYGPFGVFLGGRREFLVAGKAFLDAPIFGHGSLAEGNSYRVELWYLTRQMFDIRDTQADIGYIHASNLIPTHSHILSSIVDAGILGACFWVVVTFLFVRILRYWHLVPDGLRPLVVLLIVNSFWDILFSPFGGERRMYYGFVLGLFSYIMDVQFRFDERSVQKSQATGI